MVVACSCLPDLPSLLSCTGSVLGLYQDGVVAGQISTCKVLCVWYLVLSHDAKETSETGGVEMV